MYTSRISPMLGHQTLASALFAFHLSSYPLQMNEFITKSRIS